MMSSPLDDILTDPVEFISRLTIKNKAGKLVPFGSVITPEQIQLIRAMQTHKRIIIVKSRQMGISTVVRAFCFWQALTSREAITTAVVSNKERAALALMDIDRRFYTKLPKALQRQIAINAYNRIQFASNGTNIMAMTAKADSQDRGHTLNMAHCSELAFYTHADVYLSSLIASINEGSIIIESTPHHFDDALHKLVQANEYSKAWHVVFLPWSAFPDYTTEDHVSPTEYESQLMAQHGLSIGQISWRRKKIAEMQSETLFKKEYPLTISEAWTIDDNCYLRTQDLAQFQYPHAAPATGEFIFEAPNHHLTYAMGVDPAGGTGGDYSVATVVSKVSNAIVAKISSNKYGLQDFALRAVELARKYNDAFIQYEQNNHGHGFEQCLATLKYHNCGGYLTTASSKIALYDEMRTHITQGTISNIDSITLSELRMLQASSKGLAPKHPSGAHDDHVIAFALALHGLQSVKMPEDLWEKQFGNRSMKPAPRAINPLQASRGMR